MLKDKKILVAGATGLVGSNLITRLLNEGAKVRATLHQKEAVVVDSRIDYVRADLRQGPDCERVVKDMEIVYLCAASTSGAAAITKTPMIHVTPNVLINSQMLEAAYQYGVKKLVWLSSTTGYPPSGDRPIHEEEMFEGEPFEKYYFVGWMKRFTEVLCKMYGEKLPRKMTTIVLRPTNIYGENDDFEPSRSHVLPALVRKVVERQNPIEVWGDGKDLRDVIHVSDMVEVMIRAAVQLEAYDVFNIGIGKAYSVDEILRKTLELDGYTDAKVIYDPSKPTMIPKRKVDVSKAKNILGWEAKIDLEEGLKRTIDWYRKNPSR